MRDNRGCQARLSFPGHRHLLRHLAEHATVEPPRCRDCRLPQSLIIAALFMCSRGCMVTTPAPTYDVPRPTAPEVGAVGESGHSAAEYEAMWWAELVTPVPVTATESEPREGVSSPGYEARAHPSPAADPTPVNRIPGTPAPIYAELKEERWARRPPASTDVPAAPPPVPPLWDSGWESSEPPTEEAEAHGPNMRVGSNSDMAFKLRQLLGRVNLASVKLPLARKSYGSPNGPRLLPFYGRGVSREGVNFCLYCNHIFPDVPSLDEHIRTAYANVFRCPLCTRDMLRSSARRHMKKKHSDIYEPAKSVLDNTIMMLQHKKRVSSL